MSDYNEAVTFIMDYIEENDYIINCVYDSIGRDELKRFFCTDFLEIILSIVEQAEEITGKKLESGYKNFLCHFYMEASAGMLIDWIKERDKKDCTVVIDYISRTIRQSLIGILNA